jgi:hypothetical protein
MCELRSPSVPTIIPRIKLIDLEYLLTPRKMSNNPVPNPAYVLPDNSSQRYPALQVDEYEPKNLQSRINFCLSENSVELLTDEALKLLNPQPVNVAFKKGNATVFVLNNLQAIVLDVSSVYIYDKNTERYSQQVKGQELGSGRITARKVFFALIVGDKLLKADDDTPQIFTLNLRSFATDLVKPSKPETGDGSIYSLNLALSKHYKLRGKLTHLVSVPLLVAPITRTSKSNGEFSYAPKYSLGDKAVILSQELQKTIFDLLQDPKLRSAIDNPYRIDAVATACEVAPPDNFYDDRIEY